MVELLKDLSFSIIKIVSTILFAYFVYIISLHVFFCLYSYIEIVKSEGTQGGRMSEMTT